MQIRDVWYPLLLPSRKRINPAVWISTGPNLRSLTTQLVVDTNLVDNSVRLSLINEIFNIFTDLNELVVHYITSSIGLVVITDVNENIIRSSQIVAGFAEQTDFSQQVYASINRSASLVVDVNLVDNVVRSSIVNTQFAENTDLSFRSIASIGRSISFVEDTTLSNTVVLIAPSTSESVSFDVVTDFIISTGQIRPANISFVEDTVLISNIIRSRIVSINIAEETDYSSNIYAISGRSINLISDVDLTDQIIRQSYLSVNISEQTDFNATYNVISPLQSISASLDIATDLNIALHKNTPVYIGLFEETDFGGQCVRYNSFVNNFNISTDITSYVVNASIRNITFGEQTDLNVSTGRITGQNISFNNEVDLFSTVFGATAAQSISTNLTVDVNLTATINRLFFRTIGFDTGVDINVNRRIQYYTVCHIDSSTEFDISPAQRSSCIINLDTTSSLVILVNVTGEIVPIQELNFILTSINQLQFTLSSINQLNFSLS